MKGRRILFVESQIAPVWAWILMLGSAAAVSAAIAADKDTSRTEATASGAILGVTFVLLILCLFRMTTRVTDEAIEVQFGWIPCYRKRVPVSMIAQAEAKRYRPLWEYGGWGIRGMGKKRALNMRGDLGVLLTLRDGATLMIGSARPDLLAGAIGEAAKN